MGSYSDVYGAAECKSCPGSQSTVEEGATNFSQCQGEEFIFKWFNNFVYKTIVLKIGKCRGLYMYNNDIFFFDCDIIIIKNNWFLWLCKGRVECKSLVAIC